jgi:hypothetical protein
MVAQSLATSVILNVRRNTERQLEDSILLENAYSTYDLHRNSGNCVCLASSWR